MSGTDDFLRAGLAFGQVWVWNGHAVCFLIHRDPNSRVPSHEWFILRLDDSRPGRRVQIAHFDGFDGWQRIDP